MDVDVHARRERRQHVEVEAVDVAARLRDVRRVDEQDVARGERRELVERDILHLVRDEPRESLDAVLEERARIRLDAGDVDAAAEPAPVDVRDQQRRIAGADLDDPARAPVVQEHEQRAGVEPAELRVARVEIGETGPVGQHFRIVVQRQVAREGLRQHAPVTGVVPIDAGGDGRRRPQAILLRGGRLRIDERRIEVSGRDERCVGRPGDRAEPAQKTAHGAKGSRERRRSSRRIMARARRSPARGPTAARPCAHCGRCGSRCTGARAPATAGCGRCAVRGSSETQAAGSPTS